MAESDRPRRLIGCVTIDLPGVGSVTIDCAISRHLLADPGFDVPAAVRRVVEPAIEEIAFDLRERATGHRPGRG